MKRMRHAAIAAAIAAAMTPCAHGTVVTTYPEETRLVADAATSLGPVFEDFSLRPGSVFSRLEVYGEISSLRVYTTVGGEYLGAVALAGPSGTLPGYSWYEYLPSGPQGYELFMFTPTDKMNATTDITFTFDLPAVTQVKFSQTVQTEVPEPGSLVLAGIALLGLTTLSSFKSRPVTI